MAIDLTWREEEFRDAFSDTRKQYVASAKTDDSLYNIVGIPLDLEIKSLWWSPNVMNAFPRFSMEKGYRIILNRGKKDAFLAELNFNDMKGWFAHELGHIPRYMKKQSMKEFASFTAKYLLNQEYKLCAEREADLEAFKHGLGLELLISAKKSFVSDTMPKSYKKFEKFYIQPWDVIVDYAPKEMTKEVYDKIIASKSVAELNTFYDLKK